MRSNYMADCLRVALEGFEEPEEREIEYMFLYKLGDLAELQQAAVMKEQEQWEVRIPKVEGNRMGGHLRVRAEWTKDAPDRVYTFCSKLSDNAGPGRPEVEEPSTEGVFAHFKELSAGGMRKLRCEFPVPGTEGTFKDEKHTRHNGALVWEVDVFRDRRTGQVSPWVKVDLEVPALMEKLPAFPLTFEAAITAPRGKRTEEEERFVKELFANVFTTTPTEADAQEAAQNEPNEPETQPESGGDEGGETKETPEAPTEEGSEPTKGTGEDEEKEPPAAE